jgi:hypothetical protein
MFRHLRWDYTGRPSESESLWKKMIEEPYSGKLNVRFDEGCDWKYYRYTPA